MNLYKVRRAGYAAYVRGEDPAQNPYEPDTPEDFYWNQGYLAAHYDDTLLEESPTEKEEQTEETDRKTLWQIWDILQLWTDEQWSSDELEEIAEVMHLWKGDKKPTPEGYRTLDLSYYQDCTNCGANLADGVYLLPNSADPICWVCHGVYLEKYEEANE